VKTRTLLARLGEFLREDGASQRAELESIRKVLKQLKKKEKRLKAALEDLSDPDERDQTRAKLEVVHAQRVKGLERVLELRTGKDTTE
jgi:cell division protein FtsB